MHDLEIKPNHMNQYNDEPVLYCKHCLSLKIRDAGLESLTYCDDCGSTDIEETDIFSWENMYEGKYGFKYLDKNF